MIQTKKQMFLLIGSFLLVILLGTVTYAFFNYTRTGTVNIIKTGRISFSASQGSNTISLDNIMPIPNSEVYTDENNVAVLNIDISGDTEYSRGIEYLLTAVDVNNTVNNKEVPIRIMVIYEEKNGRNIGTSDNNYFTNRGGNTSLYKVLATGSVSENGNLLVGYIKPDTTGIDGVLTIYAYVDSDDIMVSDTFEGTTDKVVLTTDEWNGFAGNNALSFKVKVEANEGIWVEEQFTTNAMNTFPSVITNEKNKITEIYFNKMDSDTMQARYDAATIKADITYNDEGKVLAWLEENTIEPTGTSSVLNIKPGFLSTDYIERKIEQIDNEVTYKLYVVSDGKTYLTTGNNLFLQFYNTTKIEFNNINTQRVISMNQMFYYCNKLATIIGINTFDTSSVTDMYSMFYSCSSLTSLDLSNFDTSKVRILVSMFYNCSKLANLNLSGLGGNDLSSGSVNQMFYGCNSLKNLDMSNFNFGSIFHDTYSGTSSSSLFYPLRQVLETLNLSHANFSGSNVYNNFQYLFDSFDKLQSVDLSYANFTKVIRMYRMFNNCSSLINVNLTGLETPKIVTINYMFSGCSSIEKIDMSNLGGDDLVTAEYVFNDCSNLKEVIMQNFNFGQVTNIGYIFKMINTTNNIEKIDLSNAQFYTDMDYLFYQLSNLKTIDLTGVSMTNVTDMSAMFFGCSSLQSIDLSSFNTSGVTDMYMMFKGCTSLITIYVGNNWSTSGLTSSISSENMFLDCTSLVGGQGTTFDSSVTDKTYAKIDGGQSNPGYLTLKTN